MKRKPLFRDNTTWLSRLGILLILLLIQHLATAQSSIEFSKYLGGDNRDDVYNNQSAILEKDGYLYTIAQTRSSNINTTDGSTLNTPGEFDMWFIKQDTNGNLIHSKLMGGNNNDIVRQLQFHNNSIYALGTSNSSNFPTTDGSMGSGQNDLLALKLDTAGTVDYARLIGGSGNEVPLAFAMENNEMYIIGQSASPNFPVTDTSTLKGTSDQIAIKLNASGNTVYSRLIGGSGFDGTDGETQLEIAQVYVKNGQMFYTGSTYSNNYPTTVGPTTLAGGGAHITAVKLGTTGAIAYARVIGGSDDEAFSFGMEVINDEMYIFAFPYASDYPVTNGIPNPQPGDDMIAITKLSSSGNIIHSKFLSSTQINISDVVIYNNEIYLSGIHNGAFPTTNGTVHNGSNDCILLKIDTAISTNFASYYGGSAFDYPYKLEVNTDGIYFFGYTASTDFPVTNGSIRTAPANQNEGTVMKLDHQGDIVYSSYLGSSTSRGGIRSGVVLENKIITQSSVLQDYVVTNPMNTFGNPGVSTTDLAFTKIDLCPNGYTMVMDTLSPSKQLVCIDGFIGEIIGKKVAIPSDSMVNLYYGGIKKSQNEIEANYQWQSSTSPTGPWTDISGAVRKNFTPQPTSFNVYFRRLARKGPCCNNEVISISNIDTVEVSSFTAPTVDAGGVFNSCSPSAGITIGATPLPATGGLSPYSYSWDFLPAPDSALSNPSVAPTNNTVYTLTVVDANGCKQVDQAIVNIYSANAGPDVSSCAGDSVRLQGVPLPAISGVSYSWSPTTGVSQPSLIQPNVLPIIPTDYELTMTFPKTGGGTCTVRDTTTVIIVAAPVTPNFAGTDQTLCSGETAPLGETAEAGFNYTWAPGNYLTSNSTAATTYQPGSLQFPPIPDSGIYTVTAARLGCFFTDQVSVFVINADAGIDGCGPRVLGVPSRTDVPTLNETFQWKKLSGGGMMLADSNTPTVPISASPAGQPTTYVLLTTLNGITCTDTVIVPACVCGVNISVNAPTGCPNFNLNPVTLTANPLIGEESDYSYSWTPNMGLSAYNTQSVSLTDNVSRTYTVTTTSLVDPTFSCNVSINVNQPAMTIPVFNANDTTVCAGETVNIGQTTVVGYTYNWTPTSGLNPSATISNPSVTPTESIDYFVRVTDAGTGCFSLDTANITVREPKADAGTDWTICNAATVTLGTPAEPGHIYAWTPGNAPFQNGTDSTSAMPQILVAADLTFFLQVTDTLTGCIAFDTVMVNVNGSPTILNAPDIDLCVGTSDTIGSPAMPGVTYVWTSPSGTGDLSDPTIAQPIVTVSTTATYTVTASFTGGCNAMDLVTVTLRDPSFTLTDLSYCPSSGAVALGTAAPTGMTAYSWNPIALVTDATIANPNTLTPPPPSATTFTLTVTDAFGCMASDGITITPTVDPPNAGGNRTLCLNETTQIGDVNNSTGGSLSYNWSPSAGLDNPTSINPTFTPTSTGTFKFALDKTDASIPCTSSDTITIIVMDYSLAAMPSTTVCQNASTIIGVTNIPGAQYFWSPGSTLSDSTVAMPTANPATTTTYTLTSIGLNGCIDVGTTTVGVNPNPSPIISIEDTVSCLGDPSVRFNPSVSPMASNHNYLWAPNDGTIDDIYILNPTITPGGIGNKVYTLNVTDTAGCSTFKTATLTVATCPVLSVDLVSFTVTKLRNRSFIQWKTASEYNNSYFDIERLNLSGDWSTIESIAAANQGNNLSIHSYEYIDYSPWIGKNYYRIKIVDQNGSFEYSDVRLVDFSESIGQVLMHPNPADSKITLSINNNAYDTEIHTINVLGLDGRKFTLPITQTNERMHQLDTKKLSQGSYVVQVTTSSGHIINFRLVIIR